MKQRENAPDQTFKRTKRILLICGLFLTLCLCLAAFHACGVVYQKLERKSDELVFGLKHVAKHDYSQKWIIGKTSAEIVEKYGEFDSIFSSDKEKTEGLYRNVTCAYQLTKAVTGYWGTGWDSYYLISFDENGVAVSVDEEYIPLGQT